MVSKPSMMADDSALFPARMAALPRFDTVHRIPLSTRRESPVQDSRVTGTAVKAPVIRGGGLHIITRWGRHLSSKSTGLRHWRQRFNALFQDHEIFVRTHGHVRFLRISATWQKRVALIAAAVLLAWAGVTLAILVNQLLGADERAAVAQQQAAASAAEQRIARYRDRVAETAADLEERQVQLEEWSKESFGAEPAAVPDEAGAEAAPAAAAPLKTSAIDPNLPPEAQALARLEARQEAFASRLLAAVNDPAAKAETAVAALGLDPRGLVRHAAAGRGGPFIPYRGKMGKAKALGASFAALEGALFRMEVLERTLVAVPSGNPANVLMMSSGFGYRSDPFTGGGPMD